LTAFNNITVGALADLFGINVTGSNRDIPVSLPIANATDVPTTLTGAGVPPPNPARPLGDPVPRARQWWMRSTTPTASSARSWATL
jgi:hypothetical protein